MTQVKTSSGESLIVFSLLTIYSELLTTQGRGKSPILMTVQPAVNDPRESARTTCDDSGERQPLGCGETS